MVPFLGHPVCKTQMKTKNSQIDEKCKIMKNWKAPRSGKNLKFTLILANLSQMTFVMKIYVIKILENNFQILLGKIGRNFSHSGKISDTNIERNFCQNWKETAKLGQNWKEISFFLPLILHPVIC